MPFFKTISEKQAKGKVKKVFDDIKKTRKIKKIPNFWKTLASSKARMKLPSSNKTILLPALTIVMADARFLLTSAI